MHLGNPTACSQYVNSAVPVICLFFTEHVVMYLTSLFWQLRDISFTPYGQPLAVLPANPELHGPNAIVPDLANDGGLINDADANDFVEDAVVLQDIVSFLISSMLLYV